MKIESLRRKRLVNEISGDALRHEAGIHPTRLSRLERGSIPPTPGELERIDAAIERILSARERLKRLAADAGLSLTGVRF